MARNGWVELDSAGVREVLKAPALEALLLGIANDVNSAGGGVYEARTRERSTRVIGEVLDNRNGARFIESATGNLARALGSVKK